MLSGVGETTQLSDMDGPVVRMACNLKCLKDQASILCAVHEAVGLEDLKRISQAFREDIYETCSFVKRYILVSPFYQGIIICHRTLPERKAQ